MIVIFEGLDSVGKTTQAKRLFRYLNENDNPTFILHTSALNTEATSKQYYRSLFDTFRILDDRGRNIILDRSHIGEAVYAPKYRKYSGNYVFNIEHEIRNFVFFDLIHLVYLHNSDMKELVKREDGESLCGDSITEREKEHILFLGAIEKSYIKHKHVIDVTNKTKAEVWEELIQQLGI